ncbi:S41 family peptidase [Xanthomonas vesicatoria]|uniref:Tail specific protease domain-containing protein n=2 Tax=Xanthomonas vesicatoria TaxID=56460 RepID=A0ABS8LC97_9XANT|nr:S41 family peptidase [Xanthomonas vesicatoria]MCC8596096.1 hypothetical protein [Xanthomonas vesicatoria]MCC8603525.1 hypothetical protein [Xanthomonas vesicatoria]MCC8617481.1 hypothetical protein [Xanthomonas vesicatoria]MCC8623385.1 hypothetical protein [Xanthomonas vesicatoria]MCC8627526.1 hypothetical protein [Xanthomonas vesicatoria]
MLAATRWHAVQRYAHHRGGGQEGRTGGSKRTGRTHVGGVLCGDTGIDRSLRCRRSALRRHAHRLARQHGRIRLALTGRKPVKTYEMSASGTPGIVHLEALQDDASCGSVAAHKPLIALVDAGNRSAGELLATYLWASGATFMGEHTIGAGGGRDSQSQGGALGDSGYRALVSDNFYIFDPTDNLRAGEMDEATLVDRVATDVFLPKPKAPLRYPVRRRRA